MKLAGYMSLALRHRLMLLGIRAFSTSADLQATGRRRKMLWMSCPAALNQRKSAVIGPTRERGRIEFLIASCQILPNSLISNDEYDEYLSA